MLSNQNEKDEGKYNLHLRQQSPAHKTTVPGIISMEQDVAIPSSRENQPIPTDTFEKQLKKFQTDYSKFMNDVKKK